MEKIKQNRYLILIAVGQTFYFILLTLLFTRPLYQKISTHIAGSLGDNLYFIWQIGWFKQSIFDLGQLPFHSHLLNFPYGYNLAITEIAPLQLLFAQPFALSGNLVLGYNVSMLLTFILAGMTMSYWVYDLTGSRFAGLVSGTAYAFLPYHMVHFLSGHLNISAIQWFPLYFWGFTAILTGGKKSRRNIILMAVGLSGIALSSQYYLYMTFLVSGLIVIINFAFFDHKKVLDIDFWKRILIAGLLSLPALAVGIVPYYLILRGMGSGRSMTDVMTFSASITDFVLPFTRQVIAGEWVWRNFPRDLWNEATLYLGIPLTILAGIGFAKRKQMENKPLFRIFLIGFLVSIILAMGTNLTWMEEAVTISESSWLAKIFNNEDNLVLLPGYLLYKYLPFYSIMRAWMRIAVIAMIFNCAAAGIGVSWLIKKTHKKMKPLISIIILLLVILDFYVTPNQISEVKPRQVDQWLADQPYGGQIQLPLKQNYEEYSLYYTLTSQKPIIGVIRTFPSNRYFELDPLLSGFPDETSVQALVDQGLTYIVLDETYYTVNDEFIQQCERLGLTYAISLDGQTVLRIE